MGGRFRPRLFRFLQGDRRKIYPLVGPRGPLDARAQAVEIVLVPEENPGCLLEDDALQTAGDLFPLPGVEGSAQAIIAFYELGVYPVRQIGVKVGRENSMGLS